MEMKTVVNDFIQILANIPELNIMKETSVTIEPTIAEKKELKIFS